MHIAGPASRWMWFFNIKRSATEHFAGAASAKRVHALQRRFEQGLLHRKVHQGGMGYVLLGWKSAGPLFALFPLVSIVAAPAWHPSRHGFFRRHRHGERALRFPPAGLHEDRWHVRLRASAQPGGVAAIPQVRWPGSELQHAWPTGYAGARHSFLRAGREYRAL